MHNTRGVAENRSKESAISSSGSGKECFPIFPTIAVQAFEGAAGNDDVPTDTSRKSENHEIYGASRHLSDATDVTESPTIVKSKSLSKKIRERQTRDKSASDADRTIPALYANGTNTKSSSMLKSLSHASNLSNLEGGVGPGSDDSPPSVSSEVAAHLPSTTVTPNRSRSASANAPHTDGIASPDNVSASLPMSLPLSWTTTHTNLTSIISSGANNSHSESVLESADSKHRGHDTHSPPSAHLANLHLGSMPNSTSSSVNHSAHNSARSSHSPALNAPGVAAAGGNPFGLQALHHAGSGKTSKEPSVHAVERTLPPKSLEKINPSELATNVVSSGRPSSHGRTAAGASNSSKLSALSLSPAQTSAKSRAASSSTSTMLSLHGLQNPAQVGERQFLIALEGPPRTGPVTVEDDNDRIVQERLMEAKAMDRTKASGAVMHQFSLWNKVPTKAASGEVSPVADRTPPLSGAPIAQIEEVSPRSGHANRLSSIAQASNAPSVGFASDSPSTSAKKATKLRGPKAALAIQSLADEEAPRRINPFSVENSAASSRSHSRTSSNDLGSSEAVRASITSVITSTPDYESKGIASTDRSFNSDTLDEDYTMEFEPLAGEIAKASESDAYTAPLGSSAGSSLAAALRKKVGGAKQTSSSSESLQALTEGKGPEGSPSQGSSRKHADPLADRLVYVTPEKRSNPLRNAHHSGTEPYVHYSDNLERVDHYDGQSDGWDDDFVDEDEELRKLSDRPRSAENRHRTPAEIETEAIIKTMSKSGPAAFASPKASPRGAHKTHLSAAEEHPNVTVRGILPTQSTSERTALRRSTTTGDNSRLLINQLEELGHHSVPDSPSAMKSMTSRSASECNIAADAVAALSRTPKGGSSKYQTLRNLKTNKSERFQITPMTSNANLNQKTEMEVIKSAPTYNAQVSESLAASAAHNAAEHTRQGTTAQEEHSGEHHLDDEEEEDEREGSPTLSELSDTEDPAEEMRLAQSPLRLEASHSFGLHTNGEGHRERTSSEGHKVDEDDEESPLRWKKGEAIGEGTFGKVFKGMNEKTGELLAIKQLALMDGSSAEVDSLRREISVMWNLEHENIVRYMGTSKTDRYLYIILEYVTGGSIAGMITQFGPFTEKLIKRFSSQILSGVEYLHSKGIVHRDIKGANILVSDAGVAKLADFGCSKQLAGVCTGSIEESMKAIRGSVPWMAPEVIKQSGHGLPSDIWSFGATVIEMATGKPPWPEFTNSMAALFHVATSNTPPPMPPNVSTLCTDFLARCLVIDPADRATAQELLTQSDFLRNATASNTSSSATAAHLH